MESWAGVRWLRGMISAVDGPWRAERILKTAAKAIAPAMKATPMAKGRFFLGAAGMGDWVLQKKRMDAGLMPASIIVWQIAKVCGGRALFQSDGLRHGRSVLQ